MRFKSASFWSGLLDRSRTSLSTFLLVSQVALSGPDAEAAITVTPVGPGAVGLSNVVSNTAYYPVLPYLEDTGSPPRYFLDTEDKSVPGLIDLGNNQSSQGSGTHKAAPDDLILFTITSSAKGVSPPSGGHLVVFITAQGNTGSGEKVVPIAFAADALANGAVCPGVSGCLSLNSINSFNYYFSYKYTMGTTVTLGVYPSDVCLAYRSLYGGTANGCSGSSATVGSTGSPLQLKFYVNTIPNDGTNGGTTALNSMLTNPVDSSSASMNVVFEDVTAVPSLSCPASFKDLYQPGDGELLVNTSMFSGRMSGTIAPINKVIVIGNDGAAPVVSKSYLGANTVHSVVNIGTGQTVSGFTNTTTGTDHYYQLAFLMRDAAGIVATGGAQTCALSNVQTTPIQGFLAKSSCFIATAAYRSTDASPVMMLRRFRDTILMKSGPGRAFVRWYYHWSPPAAEWLMRNPEFRYPVLVALIPIEMIAWSFLHPVAGLLFLLLTIAMSWYYFQRGLLRASDEGVADEA